MLHPNNFSNMPTAQDIFGILAGGTATIILMLIIICIEHNIKHNREKKKNDRK